MIIDQDIEELMIIWYTSSTQGDSEVKGQSGSQDRHFTEKQHDWPKRVREGGTARIMLTILLLISQFPERKNKNLSDPAFNLVTMEAEFASSIHFFLPPSPLIWSFFFFQFPRITTFNFRLLPQLLRFQNSQATGVLRTDTPPNSIILLHTWDENLEICWSTSKTRWDDLAFLKSYQKGLLNVQKRSNKSKVLVQIFGTNRRVISVGQAHMFENVSYTSRGVPASFTSGASAVVGEHWSIVEWYRFQSFPGSPMKSNIKIRGTKKNMIRYLIGSIMMARKILGKTDGEHKYSAIWDICTPRAKRTPKGNYYTIEGQ
ncbi:hypothetical protein EV368DRAFT_67192 [Lentinula lateritia]|nr:hypothetical protein EV368DRAFT_67192 [Lentinula lateritia]